MFNLCIKYLMIDHLNIGCRVVAIQAKYKKKILDNYILYVGLFETKIYAIKFLVRSENKVCRFSGKNTKEII